jgi:hypothetical protein
VIGFAGREREISASNFPGTKTFPFWEMSALNFALADVSKSEPDSVISSATSMTIPKSAVVIGRFEIDFETQLTASTKESLSTANFICSPFLIYILQILTTYSFNQQFVSIHPLSLYIVVSSNQRRKCGKEVKPQVTPF